MKDISAKLKAILTASVISPLLIDSVTYAANADLDRITNTALTLVKILTGFGAVIAIAFIIVGSIKMSSSSGNPQKLDSAKSTMFWAVGGFVIGALAFVIINVVQGSISS